MSERKAYRVVWEIEVEARSAQEAAEIAREIQLEIGTLATRFFVEGPEGRLEVDVSDWREEESVEEEEEEEEEDGAMEFTETPQGEDARDRWARAYDELNGAPEGGGDV
jgi:hypothetical protein